MNFAKTYAKIRSKVVGDSKSPWYTRWVWWIAIVGAFAIVVGVWYFAKQQESTVKARAKLAKDEAQKARLEVQEANAQADIKELERKAEEAEKRAAWLERRVEESAKERQLVENAIKGATSWEELDALEKEIG